MVFSIKIASVFYTFIHIFSYKKITFNKYPDIIYGYLKRKKNYHWDRKDQFVDYQHISFRVPNRF